MRKWPFLNMFLIGFQCMLSLVSSCLSFLSIFEKSLKMAKIHIFEKISISSRDIHLNYIFRNRSRRAKIGFFYLDTLSFNSFQTTQNVPHSDFLCDPLPLKSNFENFEFLKFPRFSKFENLKFSNEMYLIHVPSGFLKCSKFKF